VVGMMKFINNTTFLSVNGIKLSKTLQYKVTRVTTVKHDVYPVKHGKIISQLKVLVCVNKTTIID
jgi:hypothetical protein